MFFKWHVEMSNDASSSKMHLIAKKREREGGGNTGVPKFIRENKKL